MSSACPPDGELERLLAGQLSDAEEQALETHVSGCEACQQTLEGLTHFERPIHILAPSQAGDGKLSARPGGILGHLANSSRPVLPRGKKDLSLKRPPTESTLRGLGRSASIAASGRFLRRQFWTWPLLAAAVLSVAGWWVNRSVESAMRQQRIDNLTTVLEADIAALREWMDNQRATAELVVADESLRPMVQELLALSDAMAPDRDRLVQAEAQAALRSRLAGPLRKGGFTGFLLVSPSGIAVAVDEDAPVGAALTGYRRDFFARVCAGQAAVSKPFLSPLLLADSQGELRTNQPCMYAAAPIHDEGGRPIAALGLRIRPDDQFSRILHVARSGSTGETYAFDRSGLLLNQSRFDDDLKQIGLLVDQPESRSILNVEVRDPGVNLIAGDRPMVRRAEQPLTRMAGAAVQGIDGYDVNGYRDYRGVPVVGAWRWLDDYDFGVATEMDVDEAFAPVAVLRRTFAVLLGLLVAASVGILLAMLYIARQQRKLNDATRAAQKFGQYTLVERLGSGGMGTVYKAQHALLRRPTAVKLINPEMISDATIARFEREVQLTSELTHPNTVAIYDYGRTPEGVVYYAMEYLEGVNLDDLVSRYGPLPEGRVVYLLRQVCASLAEAHAAGLVHRDVKPANIVLTFRGGQHDFVKLLDFGLAKPVGDLGEAGVTLTDSVPGTPLYVSPEAVTRAGPIDARADVYAIGAVGYYLLTGVPVFSGSSAMDICLLHVSATPEPPSSRTGQPVSSDLESLLMHCLAKSPADRPDHAADLLHRLEKCAISGHWTPADAARWWEDRDQERSAASQPVASK